MNEIFYIAEVENINIVREKYNDRYITLLIPERTTLKNKGVKEVYSLIFNRLDGNFSNFDIYNSS